jgi:hypothetical protein
MRLHRRNTTRQLCGTTFMVKKYRNRQLHRTTLGMIAIVILVSSIQVCLPQSNPYVWRSIIAGGGGFVPGIVYHPTAKGLAYARTDIGGAYRWDDSSGKWIPLQDMMTRNNSDYMGILSIGLDRNDTNRVYMECGKYTQSWAGAGAVLSSTDKGNTWTIYPLTVKIGGNEDGRGAGERLQVDPNLSSVLLMGTTANGLWRSINYGVSWTRVSTFSPTNVNFVRFDPASSSPGDSTQRVFVAAVNTSGQSLYRSDDGGKTWSVVSGQPTGVMAIRSDIADTLLYLTFANYQGPNNATTGSVWKYGIPSGTWTNISPSSGSYGFSGISVYPKNPNIVIVSTLDRWSPMDEVYMSTNGGTDWTTRLTSATLDHSYAPYTAGNINPHWLAALAMDPFDSSKAMFGTGYGIWASDNLSAGTPTWYFKDENLEETVPMQIISPPFTNLLSAMGDYDGFRHDNLDVSPPNRYFPYKWTTLSLAFAGKVPSTIVKAYNASPYGSCSTDGGSSWRDFAGRPSGTTAGGSWMIAVSADGKTFVWAPTGGSMSYSTNDGSTWTTSSGGVPAVPPAADRVNPNIFYAYQGVNGRMWVSTDGGKTFSQGAGGLPTVPSYQAQDGNASTVPDHEGDVWICCGSGGLYRSITSGSTATKIGSVSASYRLGFGKALNAGGYPALYLYGTVDGTLGFFRSNDTGASWTRINDDRHQFGWVHQITGDPRIYGRCYISAEGRGMSYGQPDNSDTTDNPSTFRFLSSASDSLRHPYQNITATWSRASDPLSNALTYVVHFFGPGVDTSSSSTDTAATFSAGNIQAQSTYVLTGSVTNGFNTTASSSNIPFLTASILTDVEEQTSGVPASYALHQNYPNPFNPSTTISFDLPSKSFVTVKIFDLMGREVATIAHGELQAGRHQRQWNAEALSSGIYFCRLQAGSFTETRKLILLR